MELKDLAGEHVLDAVDFSTEHIIGWMSRLEDCNAMRFRLDGVVYVAIEDPEDGYRSYMRDLMTAESASMTNVFPPVRVVARHRTSGRFDECDILELIDVANGNVIIEVGTENTGDYYPYYIANFHPGLMAINSDGRRLAE